MALCDEKGVNNVKSVQAFVAFGLAAAKPEFLLKQVRLMSRLQNDRCYLVLVRPYVTTTDSFQIIWKP